MATEQDDVLSIFGESGDASFSGFSSVSDEESSHKKRSKKLPKKTKSSKKCHEKPSSSRKDNVETKTCKKPARSVGSEGDGKKSSARGVDLTKLSVEDIDTLRGLLGLTYDNADPVEVDEGFSTVALENRPNLRVEIENDIFNDKPQGDTCYVGQNIGDALFDNVDENNNGNDDEWELPKLKAPEKGAPVAASLANMINMSCSSQCEVDYLTNKYKIPQNCNLAIPPTVNSEIWKVMDRRSQTIDKAYTEVQSLVGTAMTPVIKLADILKPTIATNPEAKSLLADTLTMLGQIQFNLSVRRRYGIRSQLKKKYHSLCNIGMPITTQLFGDDVARDIKACDSMQFIGNAPYYKQQYSRGRGRGGSNSRRPYGQRFQPYNRGSYRPPYTNRGGRRAPAATATAPNDRA